jgi:diacylglycerol kinase family enzyme
MKILIIFNPKAGRHYHHDFKEWFWAQCENHLPDVEFQWLETKPNLPEQLGQINFFDFHRVFIIGGDGTIREVAEYLYKNNLNIPFAIIPAGSSNMLASSLNLPLGVKSAIRVACLGAPNNVDVCLLNGEHIFLLCVSLGFWSNLHHKTSQEHKNKFGFFAYLWTLIKERKVENKLFEFIVDGTSHKITGNTILIANTLGIFGISPRSRLDFSDGLLEILIFQNTTFFGLTRLIFSIILFHNPLSVFRIKGREIILHSVPGNFAAQIDGEPIELGDKVEAEVVENRKMKIIF